MSIDNVWHFYFINLRLSWISRYYTVYKNVYCIIFSDYKQLKVLMDFSLRGLVTFSCYFYYKTRTNFVYKNINNFFLCLKGLHCFQWLWVHLIKRMFKSLKDYFLNCEKNISSSHSEFAIEIIAKITKVPHFFSCYIEELTFLEIGIIRYFSLFIHT